MRYISQGKLPEIDTPENKMWLRYVPRRPVATGGARGGGLSPPGKIWAPPRLRCPFCRNYRYWGLSPPPGILSAPPANDTWLRRWSHGIQTIRHQPIRHQPIRHQTIRHRTIRHRTIRHQSVRHQTIRHRTIRHQPIRHRTLDTGQLDTRQLDTGDPLCIGHCYVWNIYKSKRDQCFFYSSTLCV